MGMDFRNLSCGKASVKIGTYIVPIIGRICMDQLAIDITDTEGVAVGDTATLIDNQENSLLSTPCVAERPPTASAMRFSAAWERGFLL